MKKHVVFVSIVVALVAMVGAWILLRKSFDALNRPEPIVWDFSHGDTLDAVHWPKDVGGQEFERKGRFELTIVGSPGLGGKVIFHEEVQNFTLYRKGDKLEYAAIFFGGFNLTAEQAYEKAKHIMTLWQFRPENFENLESWHDGIAGHVSYPVFVTAHQQDRNFGQNPFLYPGFEVIKAGDVRLRINVFGGKPEDGTCRCGLTLTL